ncbi:MAG: hypothetical protein H6816_08120 [Phycisphaerales bacterium]|nr:hypothetical protein [Phycisphaerales bacterium]
MNWVLDADVVDFLRYHRPRWLVKFVEAPHRRNQQSRASRQEGLNAGVLEEDGRQAGGSRYATGRKHFAAPGESLLHHAA